MKKLNRLLIIEADNNLSPLFSEHQILFESISEAPVTVCFPVNIPPCRMEETPQLVLYHSNLSALDHLNRFIETQESLPYSNIIIVSSEIDRELCLLALEAGAEDCITQEQITTEYMQRAVIISQRRTRTEKQVVLSREQLLACIQNTPDVAVQWYDANGKVVFWNNASEQLFGWKADEVMDKTLDELIFGPERANLFQQKIKMVKTSGTVLGPEEWLFRTKGGQERACFSTIFSIPSFAGEPLIVCMDIDITDRKQMEKALRQSEAKYRSLVEQQADGITLFDEKGKILDVNTSATQLLQYSREEFRKMTLSDVLSTEESHQKPVRFDVLAKGESTIKQRKMRRKDGVLIDTEVHAKRIYNGIFLASVRDLSRRLEVQRRLEKEIELSNSIINSLPGLFYLFTKEGRYLRWNKQNEIISGYTAEEMNNITPMALVDDDEKQKLRAAIDEVFEKGQASVEACLLTKNGKKIPYYFTGIAVNYEGTECILGTGIDLSPVKELEVKLSEQKVKEQKKIMRAMIDAEEKEKNKLGLELHDNVNQILSVVRMYLSILNSDHPTPGVTLEKSISLLNTAIEEIRFLSHSLAVSYKFETGLTEALRAMINNIQLTKGFSIEHHISPSINKLTNAGQKLAIYRIVQEQLTNIIKHSQASKVKIKIETDDKAITISVFDNGSGFDPATVERGLGLNNITNRAEALEGKIVIDSTPGKGCRLTVTLPLEANGH